MEQAYYLGAALVAVASTAAYLYRAQERVAVTGTTSFILWAYLALQGDAVTILDDTGTAQSAPVPEEMRFIMAALSVLSLLAVVLWSLGVYPPESEGEATEGEGRFALGSD